MSRTAAPRRPPPPPAGPPRVGVFTEKSRGPYVGYLPAPGDTVQCVPSSFSPQQLWERFISQRRPVIIDGPLEDAEWKGDKWTDLAHLRRVAGHSQVKIEPVHAKGHFGTSAEREQVPFELFLDMLSDPDMAGQFYLTTQYESDDGSEKESESESESEAEMAGPRVGSSATLQSSDAELGARGTKRRLSSSPAGADKRQAGPTSANVLKRGRSATPDGKPEAPAARRSSSPADSQASQHSSTSALRESDDLDPVLPPPTAALAKEFPLPAPSIMGGLALQQCNLWLGNCTQGKSSGLHHDFHDNLYMLLSGRKRFLIWPPVAHQWLQPRGPIEGMRPNGLLLYTPDGELPAWHPRSNRFALRGDGLTEFEAAEWRVRARERALREADERAAALAGEASRPASLRKGKGKQTLEQVEAMAQLKAAELARQHIVLEERGLALNESDSEDDSDEDALAARRRKANEPRRPPLALIRSDRDIPRASDDESSEEEESEPEAGSSDDEMSVPELEPIEKAHYLHLAVPFIKRAIGEASPGSLKLSPSRMKADGSAIGRDEDDDPSEDELEMRQLNSVFLAPLLLAEKAAAPRHLSKQEALAAVEAGLERAAVAAMEMTLAQQLAQQQRRAGAGASRDSESGSGSDADSDEESDERQGSDWEMADEGWLQFDRIEEERRRKEDGESGSELFDSDEDEDESDNDLENDEPQAKAAPRRSPPLRIPKGMLPGGLRGRLNGQDSDDSGSDYDGPIFDEMVLGFDGPESDEDEDDEMEEESRAQAELWAHLRQQLEDAQTEGDTARATLVQKELNTLNIQRRQAVLQGVHHDRRRELWRARQETALNRRLRGGFVSDSYWDWLFESGRDGTEGDDFAGSTGFSDEAEDDEGEEGDIGVSGSESSGSDEDEALPAPASAKKARGAPDAQQQLDKDEPSSFSRISPQALHRYFGIADDPTDPSRAPAAPKAGEALPAAMCPPPLVVDLQPGQMLYLPASWWHEVTSYALADDGPSGADGESTQPVHMAFNYWFHPPTALKQGFAPLYASSKPAVAAPKSGKAAASGAGASGAGRNEPTGPLVGTHDQPYLDPEVWGEIRRAISAKIATAVAGDAAQRQAAALAADESDDESSEEEDDGDEEGDAGSDDSGRPSPPLPPGKRRRV